MIKLRTKIILLSLMIVFGTIFTISSVNRSSSSDEVDEAAWVFDTYYYDLYIKGDWKNPDWRAFEKYAAHPPAAKYFMGALLHAAGVPISSMEPRRFWYEHDLEIIDSPQTFLGGIGSRLQTKQIVTLRYFSAVCASIAALMLFVLSYEMAGAAAAVVSYLFLIFHPLFRRIATLATADTFFVMLTLIAVLMAYYVVRGFNENKKSAWALGVVLGLVLGISFATKIVAFELIGVLGIVALVFYKDRTTFFKCAGAFLMASCIGLVVAYILDPTIQGAPIKYTLERFMWRRDRIDIQQIVFASEKLRTLGSRFAFAGYQLFYRQAGASMILVLGIMGLASIFGAREEVIPKRNRIFVIILFFLFASLTIYALPMAWSRYVAQHVVYIILLAGLGAAYSWDLFVRWSALASKERVACLSTVVVALALMVFAQYFSRPGFISSKPVSVEEYNLSKDFVASVVHPGKDRKLHEYLKRYFEEKGDTIKAQFQKEQLEAMGN